MLYFRNIFWNLSPLSYWQKLSQLLVPIQMLNWHLQNSNFLHLSFTDCSISRQSQWNWLSPSASLAYRPKCRPQCGQVSQTPGTFLVPNKMNKPKSTKLSNSQIENGFKSEFHYQHCQWNLSNVVAIGHSQWNSGFTFWNIKPFVGSGSWRVEEAPPLYRIQGQPKP